MARYLWLQKVRMRCVEFSLGSKVQSSEKTGILQKLLSCYDASSCELPGPPTFNGHKNCPTKNILNKSLQAEEAHFLFVLSICHGWGPNFCKAIKQSKNYTECIQVHQCHQGNQGHQGHQGHQIMSTWCLLDAIVIIIERIIGLSKDEEKMAAAGYSSRL